MFSREMLGLAVLLILALAGCVLIDSCLEDCTYIGSGGEDQESPVPTPEIAGKNARVELDVLMAPPLPALWELPEPELEGAAPIEDAVLPPCPKPVAPSGWLGRRHFRSPT